MKKLMRYTSLAFGIVGLTLSGGCALLLVGAVIGAGTLAYVQGELRSSDEMTYDRAWKATLATMDELQFKVTKSQKDAVAGEITARKADDTKIVIKLKRQTDHVTELRIRVGALGDEGLSRLILTKIKQHY